MSTFVDRAEIEVRAGNGGKGSISFRHEAHVPRGGPDGGDGGRGGDVVLRVDASIGTLADLRYRHTYAAAHGDGGSGRNRSGKAAEDLVLRVPPGTVVHDVETGESVADLLEDGEELTVARGGRGGRGNARFTTSVRQAPRIAEDGEAGDKRTIRLELKLLADVGLAGLPNAGKSTLLGALTRARPKVAAYPFTTLSPNLGVARLEDRELVVADIPGLIAGAHAGVGLGDEFLRHLERTRLILHVVDAALPDPLGAIAIVERELELHGALAAMPRLYVLNKLDLAEARDAAPGVARALAARGAESISVSGASGDGIAELLKRLFALVAPRPAAARTNASRERRIAFARSAADFTVTKEGEVFRVTGTRVERLAKGIDWQSPEATAFFQRVILRSGVDAALRREGVREGDTVRIGSLNLEWREMPE
ncbi:MAG: GTPase ObgE [Chloroflexi bacterium]|nr:GTPase ObgE [Chloroflexota bacterium]